MTSRKLFFLMLWVAVFVGTCKPCGEEYVRAWENTHSSWPDRADQDKLSRSLWFEKEHVKQAAQNMKYRAEDVISKVTDKVKSTASGASQYASEKAPDAREAISEAMENGREKAARAYDLDGIRDAAKIIKMPSDKKVTDIAKETVADTYEGAKQKMYTASDKASAMARNAKDKMADAWDVAYYDVHNYDKMRGVGATMEFERDRVVENFEQATKVMDDAYESAKNTLTREAKDKYEAAKESASDATGDLGANMMKNNI